MVAQNKFSFQISLIPSAFLGSVGLGRARFMGHLRRRWGILRDRFQMHSVRRNFGMRVRWQVSGQTIKGAGRDLWWNSTISLLAEGGGADRKSRAKSKRSRRSD